MVEQKVQEDDTTDVVVWSGADDARRDESVALVAGKDRDGTALLLDSGVPLVLAGTVRMVPIRPILGCDWQS